MGKHERKEFWDNHERAADQAEKARSKPVKNNKAKAWRKACSEYLEVNPLCHECSKRGYTSPAFHVLHIDPPDGSQVKFWNILNWKALCEQCFHRITGGTELDILDPIPKDAKLYTVK